MGMVLGSQPGQQPMSGKNPSQPQAQGKNPQQTQPQGTEQGATHPAIQQLMQHLTTHMQSQGGQAPGGGKNAVQHQATPAKPAGAQQPQAGGKNPGK